LIYLLFVAMPLRKIGYTALSFAASGGHKEVVSLLIDREAKVDVANKVKPQAGIITSHTERSQ
jgi:ankyrin repeat protein